MEAWNRNIKIFWTIDSWYTRHWVERAKRQAALCFLPGHLIYSQRWIKLQSKISLLPMGQLHPPKFRHSQSPPGATGASANWAKIESNCPFLLFRRPFTSWSSFVSLSQLHRFERPVNLNLVANSFYLANCFGSCEIEPRSSGGCRFELCVCVCKFTWFSRETAQLIFTSKCFLFQHHMAECVLFNENKLRPWRNLKKLDDYFLFSSFSFPPPR